MSIYFSLPGETKIIHAITFLMILITTLLFFIVSFNIHPKIIMSYWWNHSHDDVIYPIPNSLNPKGERCKNPDMQAKLNAINVLAYAFLHVNPKGELHFDNSYVDLSSTDQNFCATHPTICADNHGKYKPLLGNFSAFTQLQNETQTLKKIISIGGGNDKTSLDNAIQHIPSVVNAVEAIVHDYHLDGVDLDFEPDTFTPQRGTGYARLLEALRKKLGDQALIIVTLSAYQTIHPENLTIMAKNASFISDMCYSFHGPSYPPYYTGYSSNLYKSANEPVTFHTVSCDQSIQRFISLGVPAKKIILGYPAYAIAYGGVANQNNGLFQPFDPNKTPLFDQQIKEAGVVQYKAIPQLLTSGFKEHTIFYQGRASGVSAYNPINQQLLTYDNAALVKEKARYVDDHHLAGLMIWLINYDLPITHPQSLLGSAILP